MPAGRIAAVIHANANRFADRVPTLLSAAPTKVRWLVLDCSSMSDVDYSASLMLAGLIDALHAEGGVFALAAADPQFLATLENYGTLTEFDNTTPTSTRPCSRRSQHSGPAR